MIVCRYGPNEKSVSHYATLNGYQMTSLIGKPDLGLTNAAVTMVDKNLTCSFFRDNLILVNGYFPLIEDSYHILIAFGQGNLF